MRVTRRTTLGVGALLLAVGGAAVGTRACRFREHLARRLAAPPDASPAARQAPGYTVRATFVRADTEDRHVLADGSRVAPGDAIALDLEISRDAHVYVVNEDAHGEAFLLFPLPEGRVHNPLPGGQPHRLPGTREGDPQSWLVTSEGGREDLYVLVSPDPLPLVHAAIGALAAASSDRPVDLDGRSNGAAGPTAPRPGMAEQPSRALDTARPWRAGATPLTGAPQRVTGVWIGRLTLDNPRGTT